MSEWYGHDPDNEPAHDDVPGLYRRQPPDRRRPYRAGEPRSRYAPAPGGRRTVRDDEFRRYRAGPMPPPTRAAVGEDRRGRPRDSDRGHRASRRLNQAPEPRLRFGSLAPRAGIGLIFGAAVLGSVLTIALGQAPGVLLGWFLVTGTTAGALAVERRRGHLLIPVPAFAYLVAGLAAGLFYDRAQAASKTALAISAARSVASGFLPMTAAIIIAALICAGRYFAEARGARTSPRL